MAPIAASLIASMATSLINTISGKGQEGGFLLLLALITSSRKRSYKGSTRSEKSWKRI